MICIDGTLALIQLCEVVVEDDVTHRAIPSKCQARCSVPFDVEVTLKIVSTFSPCCRGSDSLIYVD